MSAADDRTAGRSTTWAMAAGGMMRSGPGVASAWLLAALSCGRSKTALAIAREVVREAYDVDDALLGFGTSGPASRTVTTDPVSAVPAH